MTFKLHEIVRENIMNLAPYSSARNEYDGAARVYLDANENSFGSPLRGNYSRYPDPLQVKIKERIAARSRLRPSEIFVGSGSDEAIDLALRIFCRPRIDNVVICPPTYGMYEVAAEINDVEVRRAALTNDFELDHSAIKNAVDRRTKIIFVCSPNNPTGNAFAPENVLELARDFHGIVVVDEAYVHFSEKPSLVPSIKDYPNLIVLQTFSKAWGLAALRVGTAFANEEIIGFFNRVKLPYNVGRRAQEIVLEALENEARMKETVSAIIDARGHLIENLRRFPFVGKIYRSDANFILAKMTNAEKIYRFLLGEEIIVRNRTDVELCAGCLRITVGTPAENDCLIKALAKIK